MVEQLNVLFGSFQFLGGNVGMLDSAKIFRTGKTVQLIEGKSFIASEGGLQHGQPQFLKLILLKPFCHFFEKKIFLSKIEKRNFGFFQLVILS
jgi:hypothetical protein